MATAMFSTSTSQTFANVTRRGLGSRKTTSTLSLVSSPKNSHILSISTSQSKSNKNLSIALCGEHGGDPKSIFYCKMLGLNYVSCSPFRVPIARLAAAQADIMGGSLKGENWMDVGENIQKIGG